MKTDTQKTTLSWREQHLLELLSSKPMKTANIVATANMAKATALKYLEGLKGQGLVDSQMIGPTKLWWIAHFCSDCHTKMARHELYICPSCGNIKELKKIEK